MTRGNRVPWAFGVIGATLLAALFVAAEPTSIIALARRAHWQGLVVGVLWSGAVMLCRGIRLALVVGRPLTVSRSVAVTAVNQFAVSLLPMRLGELTLVPLLAHAGVPGAMRALSFLLLLRVLDLASLLLLGLCTATLMGNTLGMRIAVLAVTLLGMTAIAWVIGRVLPRLATRWRSHWGLRRHMLVQLLQVRRQIRAVVHAPRIAMLVAALSFACWLGIWGMSVSVLRAVGLQWSARQVLLGVLGGSLAAAVPINAVGNFGTLETGWTVALAAQGISLQLALAAGFATHLWTTVFGTLFAAVAAGYLASAKPQALRQSPRGRSDPQPGKRGAT